MSAVTPGDEDKGGEPVWAEVVMMTGMSVKTVPRLEWAIMASL